MNMVGLTLITGAGGFVGRTLTQHLTEVGRPFRVAGRGKILAAVNRIDSHTNWRPVLSGVENVVHLAARAHILDKNAREACRQAEDDVAAVLHLTGAAIAAGVRRLIFVSSIMVHGRENLSRGRPGTEASPLRPSGFYGWAKAEAEAGLWKLSRGTALELVVLRPVLMYGPGVKGNLKTLLKLLRLDLPWPLAGVDNRRSFLNVANFADFIRLSLDHPQAAGQTFIVTDGEDLSTPQLLTGLSRALLGWEPRLWPCPAVLLRLGGLIVGRQRVGQLMDDFCFDSAKARTLLGWRPPFSSESGFRAMAADFWVNQRL